MQAKYTYRKKKTLNFWYYKQNLKLNINNPNWRGGMARQNRAHEWPNHYSESQKWEEHLSSICKALGLLPALQKLKHRITKTFPKIMKHRVIKNLREHRKGPSTHGRGSHMNRLYLGTQKKTHTGWKEETRGWRGEQGCRALVPRAEALGPGHSSHMVSQQSTTLGPGQDTKDQAEHSHTLHK